MTHALAAWAFSQDVYEVFAVVRPGNTRASSTLRNNGMQWVGETTKYFGLNLQVLRLRVADLDPSAPATLGPPGRGWSSVYWSCHELSVASRSASNQTHCASTGDVASATRWRAVSSRALSHSDSVGWRAGPPCSSAIT